MIKFLQKCIGVLSERGNQYGKPEDCFVETSKILKTNYNLELKASDIVKVLISLKIARNKNKIKEDNDIDLINYIVILNYLANKKL